MLITILMVAAGAAVLWGLSRWRPWMAQSLRAAAALSYLTLTACIGRAAIRTVQHGTVYMTEVHQFLLMPAFWIAGGYLVAYGLYRLLRATVTPGS